jgi:DNA-directed RNA polymerase beta' subunit
MIDLDYDFGYLVGAYCAEGCMTKHQISISNNDDEYLKRIEDWCVKHNLTTKIYLNKDKIQEGWTSQDIRIYSTVLCHIIENLCGKLSHNKFVSDKIVFSNRECILGFLDAYIGGDGCVKMNKGKIENIEVSSVSHKMLTSVQLMLKNLGVISKIHKPKKVESNNRGSLDIKQGYLLTVCNMQSINLAQMLNLPVQSKRDRITQLLEQTFKYDYCKSDLKIPNEVNGEIVMELRDGRCADLEFDKIISIEEVSNTTDYAYDLTVEDTRNFDCMNGLCVRDTFHLSGVATKSNVTRGVPRIEEILRLTRNPDKPSATVFLKPVDQYDKDKATNYCNMIQHTKLVDVVKSVEICFDPDDRNTRITQDEALVREFYEFEKIIDECNGGSEEAQTEAQKSKWIIRIEIDAESLLDKNITMDDIHFAVKQTHALDIHCIFSDMNSSNLVFRIRLNSSIFNKGKKKGVPEPLDQSDAIYLLKNFQDNILNNIVLRGVNGITNVNPRLLKNVVHKEDSKYVSKDTWILDTTGSNLMDLFALDFIDYTRTYSNDIREIYNCLGIEAARQNILNEFNEVMEASDAYVNYHHLSILCDRMTVKAELVPMFRSGIMNDDIGPISKGTYEMHTEMFLDASRHGDFDQMRGVSANVMCGQPGYYGTNSFSLLLDLKAMENIADTDVAEDKNINNHFENLAKEDVKCDMKKIQIENNVANIKVQDVGACDDDYNLF